jgi:cell shape-determining protein MreD
MILGLMVDLLAGQLLGQHALIFITIFVLFFLANKLLVIKTEIQFSTLSIFLIFNSFFILWVTSQSHDIFRSPNLLILQGFLTFFAYLITKLIIIKFSSK